VKVTTITKTLARELARKSLGWYRESATRGAMKCPCCRERIGADLPRSEWAATPHRMELALVRAVRVALVEHLIEPYEDATCPHTYCEPRHDVGKPLVSP